MAVLDPNEIFFTAFEPKVANRFVMYVDGIPSYIIKGISGLGFAQDTDGEAQNIDLTIGMDYCVLNF